MRLKTINGVGTGMRPILFKLVSMMWFSRFVFFEFGYDHKSVM